MTPPAPFPGLKSWLDAGLAFFYPACCQICGVERATPRQGYVCGRCRGRPGAIRYVEPPWCERCGLPFPGAISTTFECANCREMELDFSHARAAVVTTPLILDVVHRYKYRRALWFEPFLAELLVGRAAPALAQQAWDWIVPVPLHTVKEREREFNQAARLATWLSAATGIPLNARLLKRVQPTQTQTALTRPERAANVRNAFALRGGRSLSGQRVVLVDDVLTTGATTSACARALRQGGAGEVCVWTVARGV